MKITLRFQTEDRQGDLSVALLPTKLFPFRNGLDRCYLWICRSHLVRFQCEMLIIDIILSFAKCVIKNLQHPIIFALCAFQQQIKLPSNWNTTPHRVRHVCSTFTHLSASWRNTYARAVIKLFTLLLHSMTSWACQFISLNNLLRKSWHLKKYFVDLLLI